MDILNIVVGFFMLYLIWIGFRKFFRFLLRAAERIEKNIYTPPESAYDMPYIFKDYFFSRSELEFFRILNSHLDATRYTLFPKVRIADFVQVDEKLHKNWPWLNKITSKHVDYLIWDLVDSKIVLAIELDGKSHQSKKMIDRDDFVNEMYEKIGLRLERVQVGKSFEEESKRISGSL